MSVMGNEMWTFLNITLGVALGLLAEPVKARVLRRSELKLARHEIYAELADYVADIECVHRALGHGGDLEEIRPPDYDSSKRICACRPKFEVVQWYKSNRFDLLLRIDRGRGIRMLTDGMVALHAEANSPNHSVFGLPARVRDLLQTHQTHLDGKLLRKYVSLAHTNRAEYREVEKTS